mmetsp:Transcript_16067/g.13590  ORF Transcript_16067/g.13590 Transcript_16067/m.13590 type:complete len:116 (+) Transcript_16067:69-416(+)
MGKTKAEPNVDVPDGDAGIGKSIFEQQCAACHSTGDKTDAGASAPAMGGLIGRKAGATKFKYSGAMKKSGIVWTEKHIFAYLQAPGKYVPGNRMAFAGIGDAGERGHLIAYLKTL